jgi:hypothetical protein
MNDGLISKRYAKALLEFAAVCGGAGRGAAARKRCSCISVVFDVHF